MWRQILAKNAVPHVYSQRYSSFIEPKNKRKVDDIEK